MHDDDILLPNYLMEMQDIINKVDKNTSLISSRAIYFGNKYLIKEKPQNKIKEFIKNNFKILFKCLKITKQLVIKNIIYRVFNIKTYNLLDLRDFDYICKYNPLHPSAMLHNKKICIKLGGYNNDFYPSDDWYFHARCAKYSKVYQYSKFLSKYRFAINATFKSDTIKKSAIIDFIHKRDNIKVNKIIKREMLYLHYQNITKIKDKKIKNEILDVLKKDINLKIQNTNIIRKIYYKIYMLHFVEEFKVLV